MNNEWKKPFTIHYWSFTISDGKKANCKEHTAFHIVDCNWFRYHCTVGCGYSEKGCEEGTGIDINIKGVSNNFFVDKNDILQTIIEIADGKPVGKSIGSFNLKALENALQKNIWIRVHNCSLITTKNSR